MPVPVVMAVMAMAVMAVTMTAAHLNDIRNVLRVDVDGCGRARH